MSRLFISVIAGALGFAVMTLSPEPFIELASNASAVGTMPRSESVVDRHNEPLYLERVTELLDQGISNRVNMDRALRSHHSAAEYRQLLEDFRARQLGFLMSLERLEPPARLILFHERLRAATFEQVAFYAAFVHAKMRDQSIDLDRMRQHPALRASNGDVRAAWDHVQRLYPGLDRRTETALEERLLWFDVI